MQNPKNLQFETERLKADYGKFTLDPLEPGYGITIGHSLRRVLLSSIRGSAVFAVQIDGVTHEFTNIPGHCRRHGSSHSQYQGITD